MFIWHAKLGISVDQLHHLYISHDSSDWPILSCHHYLQNLLSVIRHSSSGLWVSSHLSTGHTAPVLWIPPHFEGTPYFNYVEQEGVAYLVFANEFG
jgi:hypothetical protein